MLKIRIDQDALHQTRGAKLEQARETKKECARTRQVLLKYLQGHLFKYQMRRVERHLKVCQVCASELHSLRFAADTRLLLKDITPPEGMVARMNATLSSVGRVRLFLYRPLWILLVALALASLYFFVIVPSRHDPELESIERSLPADRAVAPEPSRSAQNPVPAPIPATAVKAPVSASVPTVEPLAITITPDDQSSMWRINEVMKGHARLRKLRFTDVVREVSGSLTPGELQTLFSRIEHYGRVKYSGKRFNTLSTTELIPFVMKLKDVPSQATTVAPPQPEPTVSSPTPSAQP